MNSTWILMMAAAAPLLADAAATNWNGPRVRRGSEATYGDMIEAKREGRPAPRTPPEPASRIVGRGDGKVIVETRYADGRAVTNARTPHVIYRAAEVATNVHARRAYDAALARLARAVAVREDATGDAADASPAALTRQAERISREAEKIERGNGKATAAGVAAGALAAAGAAYLAGRRGRAA
jgi:hypothetical protein